MAIRDWSVQTLKKFAEDDNCQLKVAEQPPKGNADTDSLCYTLKRLFAGKPGKGFGNLQMHAEHTVAGPWIKEWYEEKIPFRQLINKAIETIKERIDLIPLITHSYCIWAHETQGDNRFLYLFIVESSITQMINEDLSIEPIEHLDPQTLSFAIKIDLPLLCAGSDATDQVIATVYLQRQQRKLAEAACQAFGFVSKIDTSKDTEAMLAGIERYAATLEPVGATEFKKRAVKYCQEQEKMGDPATLEGLSANADEHDPRQFVQFVEKELPETSYELRPDSRKLKQLVRFAGRSEAVSLSFSSDAFNKTVVYDADSNNLVITDIPKTLKTQLLRYMKQQTHQQANIEGNDSTDQS